MRELTKRQRAFALEYCVDLNATQAAIRAGYSEKAAKTLGSKLLRHAIIRDLVQTFRGNREPVAGLTIEFIVAGLMAIAGDVKSSERGKLEAFKQLARHVGYNASTPPSADRPAPQTAEEKGAHETSWVDDDDGMGAVLAGALKH
jgi:hypothetical protein